MENRQEEQLKYEVASELGLYEKVKSQGWKSLSSKETGRIGGLIAKRKRMLHEGKEAQTGV